MFRGRMRRIVSAIAMRTFARRKTNREKSGKRPPKSPLYQAALATEPALWTLKLAQRPESFWYPYPTLRNLRPIDQLLTASGLNLAELCREFTESSRTLGLRTAILLSSWTKMASQ
jgi:hypothetical protein